ncbi:polysaccharide pyruvyl transferase CsaB [Paenibacillaceae bacterium]|nr:polysaccharide pyruvyl transferase CsaB [Paenibacillaceae bacterium]
MGGAARQEQQSYRVAISGYYGVRNSGDEAVLKSILLALETEAKAQGVQIEPIVLSQDPAWTTKMYGVQAVHRMRPAELIKALRGCDGLISGGGSLLQDATGTKTIPYYTGVIKLAQWLGKPTFVYAQGIGPVNRRWMDPMIRSAIRKSAYVSVRDPESAALLGRIGVPTERIEVVPDPVMGLPLPRGAAAAAKRAGASADEAGRVPVVGVSLRNWRKDSADLERAAAALAALARSRAVRLRFLDFHTPDDTEASAYVMRRLAALGDGGHGSNAPAGAGGHGPSDAREQAGASVAAAQWQQLGAQQQAGLHPGSTAERAEPGEDPQLMLQEVSRCDMLLGMRLHALIYAANVEVPMLGLSYDPKIDQFLGQLGLLPVGTTEYLDEQSFVKAASSLLDEPDQWRDRHRILIADLKQRAQLPAKQIIGLLRQKRKG